ncbi:unnamed protein product [Prunus brigantina]
MKLFIYIFFGLSNCVWALLCELDSFADQISNWCRLLTIVGVGFPVGMSLRSLLDLGCPTCINTGLFFTLSHITNLTSLPSSLRKILENFKVVVQHGCKFVGLWAKIWNGAVLACAGLEGKAWRSQAQGRRMEALGFGAEAWRCDGPCARRRLALGKQATCAGLDHEASSSQVPLYLWGGSEVYKKRFVANLHRVTNEDQFQRWRAAYASAIPEDVHIKLVKPLTDNMPCVDANDPNARIITFHPFYFSLGFKFPLSKLFKEVFCAMGCAPSQCTPNVFRAIMCFENLSCFFTLELTVREFFFFF